MTDIQVFFALWGSLIMTALLEVKNENVCLVILTTILRFSVIPCFVYHSLLTKAKPEAVKSQTNKAKAHYSKDNFWVLGATFDVFKVHFKKF